MFKCIISFKKLNENSFFWIIIDDFPSDNSHHDFCL